MEYLEGMDVKSILKQSGNKKDYEWCRRVILTVLHTLKDIHKRGVLHRDIARIMYLSPMKVLSN